MDDPVKDVECVIRQLTQTPPSVQAEAINTYFTPDASFSHPFCRTGSFAGSRTLIHAIYRWYKILSPDIDLQINSVAYDAKKLVLYVNISQIFRIWFIPLIYAPVTLTTVLQLRHDSDTGKYCITSQNDLYQVNEFVKFIWPGGFLIVWIWQAAATLLCVVGALVFWPISWWEEHGSRVEARIERHTKPEDEIKR